MGKITDEQIRARAHEIWEREGRPDGRDAEHWRAAEQELSADMVVELAGETKARPRQGEPAAAAARSKPAGRRPSKPKEP